MRDEAVAHNGPGSGSVLLVMLSFYTKCKRFRYEEALLFGYKCVRGCIRIL